MGSRKVLLEADQTWLGDLESRSDAHSNTLGSVRPLLQKLFSAVSTVGIYGRKNTWRLTTALLYLHRQVSHVHPDTGSRTPGPGCHATDPATRTPDPSAREQGVGGCRNLVSLAAVVAHQISNAAAAATPAFSGGVLAAQAAKGRPGGGGCWHVTARFPGTRSPDVDI